MKINKSDIQTIDLGLPSRLRWMKYNLGVNPERLYTPEDYYGDYYQFGSIFGYKDQDALNHSSWKTCPFNNNSNNCDKGYFLNNKSTWFDVGILKPGYDAIIYHTGGKFRLPTNDDFEELLKNTTQSWVTDHMIKGLNGTLFTSKINGNILFIPASGGVCDGSFYGVGDSSYSWSSRLDSAGPYDAINLYCDPNDANVYGSERCCGFALRGIENK